ncbi:hypothetical protein HDU67_003036 [Dinochytrium kinnereticum]|nr:hypothetical protein HDU67_003036 [Dinochytrium kinnereticum]
MPRGILKHRGESDPHGAPRLRWDEDNLMMTEAQKNSTMKITEPKTPFIHYNHETDEILGNTGSVPPLELSSAISSAKGLMSLNSEDSLLSSDSERRSMAGSSRSSDWESEEEDGLTEEEKAKRKKFAKLRSQHYNMKEALQQSRSKSDDEDEDDDDDPRSRRGRTDDLDDDYDDYEDDDDEDEKDDNDKRHHNHYNHTSINDSSKRHHHSTNEPIPSKPQQPSNRSSILSHRAESPSGSDSMKGYTSEEGEAAASARKGKKGPLYGFSEGGSRSRDCCEGKFVLGGGGGGGGGF